MGMTKYQSVEKAEVLSPEDHERIGTELRRLGKTNAQSLQDLTEAERRQVLDFSSE